MGVYNVLPLNNRLNNHNSNRPISKEGIKAEEEAGWANVEDMVAAVVEVVEFLSRCIMVGLLNTSKVEVANSTSEEVDDVADMLVVVEHLLLVGRLDHWPPTSTKLTRLHIKLQQHLSLHMGGLQKNMLGQALLYRPLSRGMQNCLSSFKIFLSSQKWLKAKKCNLPLASL